MKAALFFCPALSERTAYKTVAFIRQVAVKIVRGESFSSCVNYSRNYLEFTAEGSITLDTPDIFSLSIYPEPLSALGKSWPFIRCTLDIVVYDN